MGTESREQILADFMECTGLENIDECIQVLDQYRWNLLTAVKTVLDRIGSTTEANDDSPAAKHAATKSSRMATNTRHGSLAKKSAPTGNSSARHHGDSDDHDEADESRPARTSPMRSSTNKGTSAHELHFSIKYKDRTERVTLRDNETIHQLRVKIADKLNVSPNRQQFTNWSTKKYDDHTILKDLHLPKENTIILSATASSTSNGITRSSTAATAVNSRTHHQPTSPTKSASTGSNADYPLTIRAEDRRGHTVNHELVLKANSTIDDMKKQIAPIFNIPVRQQSWNGLLGAKDGDELRQTSIRRRTILSVRKIDTSNHSSSMHRRDPAHRAPARPGKDNEPMDVDSEPVIDVDTINTYPSHSPSTTSMVTHLPSNRELLIPDRCTDDITALENFTRVFHARYASTGPILYIGSLEQAIQDSLHTSVHERRPLAIYLHHDRSVCANVFCAQVLASETIVEYLANNYVVWAWDFTADSNRARFLEILKRSVGHQHARQVAEMEKDAFPLLLIVARSRGFPDLINVIEGKSTPSEVLLNLMQSHDEFDQQRQRDMKEETIRETRENLKKQQEDEYNQSLEADLAKEQSRQADERKQKEDQRASDQLKQKRLFEQRDCQARLPEEPSDTEMDITRFKIRLPDDGGILMRRFRIHDTLQILFDYLTSHGRVFGEYKLLTTYPKRDLTQLRRSDTFEQLKLFPQEQLILESL